MAEWLTQVLGMQFYTRVGEWMKANCEIETVEVEEFGQVELANCGMVIDCSPQEFCHTGIPAFRSLINTVHASGSPQEAEEEIAYWFTKQEIFEYKNSAELVWAGIKP